MAGNKVIYNCKKDWKGLKRLIKQAQDVYNYLINTRKFYSFGNDAGIACSVCNEAIFASGKCRVLSLVTGAIEHKCTVVMMR
jgi:hypothetical protein